MKSPLDLIVPTALIATALAAPVAAQFGGSGADGVLRPTSDVTLDTSSRPLGFSYSAIHVPAGVKVRLVGAHPAILRCTGAVRIDGTLDASGFRAIGQNAGEGGPGGYDGGSPGGSGAGPAGGMGGLRSGWISTFAGSGGHATPGLLPVTPTYGTAWPFDLRGGSGGGGYLDQVGGPTSHGGDGGGGVVVLLADGAIDVAGTIRADGAGDGSGSGAGGGVLIRSATDVRVTGTVSAVGPTYVPGWVEAGDGFVRIDAWGAPPTIAPAASIEPAPLALALPAVRADEPRLGAIWAFAAACAPNDDLVFLMSTGTASIPVPPLGILQLDPAQGIHVLAVARAAANQVDPYPVGSLAIPFQPTLAGVGLHVQALALATASAEGPRLSNLVSATIR